MSATDTDRPFPLVSIITATFNSAKTVRDTLTSVATQQYPCIEHIIIDGLSTDNTMDIVHEFKNVSLVISERDNGIYDAMNKGIQYASGEIIGILNSDDFYVSPHIIRLVVERMIMDNTDALYADLVYVDPENTDKIIRSWRAGGFLSKKFLMGWMPPHPTFFVRHAIYERYGSFNLALRSAADYELMLRLLYKNQVSASYLPAVLVKMRAGGYSNASLWNRFKANREDREAWRVNELTPYFYTTWIKPLRKLSQYLTKPRLTL